MLFLHACFSEEEARMKIYSVSTRHYFAFGALVPEELSYKLKGINQSSSSNFVEFSLASDLFADVLKCS